MFSVMHKSEVKKKNFWTGLYFYTLVILHTCIIQLLRKQMLRTCILTLQRIKSIQCTATIKYIIWSYQSAIYSAYFLWSVRLYLQLCIGWLMFYFRCLCLLAVSGVQHISCCVFVLFVVVLCTQCCQFIWIVHLWFPRRYSPTFIKEPLYNQMYLEQPWYPYIPLNVWLNEIAGASWWLWTKISYFVYM